MTESAYMEEQDRREDCVLTYQKIQALSSLDAIIQFFSELRYHTDDHIPQTLASLGFPHSMSSSIRQIERVAQHQDFDPLTVYFFKVSSLTVSIRNDIVRQFRNRSGNYLLVLTDSDDFDQLDFVLLERYTPIPMTRDEQVTEQYLPLERRSVRMRPRILQVERHKLGDKDDTLRILRVLRRFTYTEADSLAQYEKLLNAYTVAMWSEPYFNNRALFSDYYLKERLPEQEEWTNLEEQGSLRRGFRLLSDLYTTVSEQRVEELKAEFGADPEKATRTHLLEPALGILGFTAMPVTRSASQQAAAPAIDPDYRLFASAAPGARRQRGTQPLALCQAYPWGRNLDGRDDTRDPAHPEKNPGAIVVSLLDSGECEWAIVTNGILWRLYSARAHSRATNYYEINLRETLALDRDHNQEAFHYFWLFFRAAAFTVSSRQVGGEMQELCLLDKLLLESDQHARKLGERLKERVFEEIFPHFARGFVSYARGQGWLPADLETRPADERQRLLEPYFNGTLTFLYRLLFLLYAESRDLLPVHRERCYYEYSLERLKNQIKQDAGEIFDDVPQRLRSYSETDTALYDRLQKLFAAVDKGNSDLNVPVYNGGLFLTDPPPARPNETQEMTVARFLQQHRLPDRYLALGLDLMARDIDEKQTYSQHESGQLNRESHKLAFIDYKSLGVRHLGSIYEGLLEFRLRIAPELMAVVEGKRAEEIIPHEEALRSKRRILKVREGGVLKERLLNKGTIYLENDRRERRATGSYYTPDYIVKYIVEQAVIPVLTRKLEILRLAFRTAQQDLRVERERLNAGNRTDTRPELAIYNKYHTSINGAFFDLKVLDPAMGSGHFLVEVVDQLTDQMTTELNRYKWSPVLEELHLTRARIEQEMEQQGITIEVEKLTDLNLLKRRVLKSCIYGVDLNPMAVELARVSLWLDCFTIGAPLSFLDHHIKCGNSLLGAEVKNVLMDVEESLWGFQFRYLLEAVQMMRKVSKLSDATAQEVAESRAAYQQAGDILHPYKNLFNVWLSQYFGNGKKAQQVATGHVKEIIDNSYDSIQNAQDLATIQAARPIAEAKRFFHWELEFPEVFFDETQRKKDGGFDAVVGNPPYIRQEGLGEDKIAFKELYKDVYNSIADLYTYFIAHSHALLRPAGRFSMITGNKFMRANYGASLREFLADKVKLEKLIDFGDLPVFEEASAYPVIIVFDNISHDGTPIEHAQIKSLDFKSLNEVVKLQATLLPESALKGTGWSLSDVSEQAVLDKMKLNATLLGIYTDDKLRRGILTGLNEAFFIDRTIRDQLIKEDPRSAEIIKPFLVGEDVKRYDIDTKEKYLIFTRRGINIENYRAVKKYLEQYKIQLEPKPSNWDTKPQGEWPGRKPGSYKWYEIQDNVAYYADFEKPKIIYPEIAMASRFTLERENFYANNKTFLIPTDDLYLLAILNSSTLFLFFRSTLSPLRGGFLEYRAQTLVSAPIRRITFKTSAHERTAYRAEAQQRYQQYLLADEENHTPILDFVAQRLDQEPEQSDVVHDLLADLAQAMLDLNREKRAKQKEFLDDFLVPELYIREKDGKSGLDALTGKSRLLDYPGDYQKGEAELQPEELLELLRKNRARIGASPDLPTFKARILTRYQQSLDQILPMKERLRRTNNLIDQIVYRLYGLTDEERAIVAEK